MKALSFCFLLLMLVAGCGTSDIQVPNDPLSGTVAGRAWNFQYGNAFINPNQFYTVRFLSTEETASDPCAVPSPGNPFISMAIPLRLESYFVPFAFDFEASPRFHISPGNSVIATSGFVEIIEIRNGIIIGLMEAQLDDDNTVIGRFEVALCN